MFAGGLVGPIFAPFVRREFTAPVILVGFAVSGYFVVRMLAEFPIGTLSDRIGPRTPLLVGRLFGIVGAIVCYQTGDIWMLIIARAVWGVGDASFFCIGMTYVSSLFPSEKRGRALGLFQAVEMTGSFLGQTAGGFLAGAYGLRSNFLASVVIGVAALAVVLLVKGNDHAGSAGSLRSILPSRVVLKSILGRTILAACLINLVCMAMNSGLMGTLFPLYATEQLGLSLGVYGLLISSSTIGNISGNLIGGIASDRFGRRKVLSAGFVVGVLSLVGLSFTSNWIALLGFMFTNGFFWGIVYGVTPAFIADSASPERRGMAIGTFRTFFDFGGVVGPLVYSGVFSIFGGAFGYQVVFYFGAASLLLNLLLASRLEEKKNLG